MADVDRTVIRESLRMTVQERERAAEEFRRAGEALRRRQRDS